MKSAYAQEEGSAVALSSIAFVYYFLPAAFVIFCLLPARLRGIFCLAVSLGFALFGGSGLYDLALLLAAVLGCYAFGRALGAARRKRAVLAAACVFHIGLLAVFKYVAFAIRTVSALIGLELAVPSIVLPVGISFYTFSALSYLFDVYRAACPVEKNLPRLALYLTMFPKLVSGPIVRYGEVSEDLARPRIDTGAAADGGVRFAVGLAKKVLIADQLGALADTVWDTAGLEISVVSAWLGMAAYTLQIYFDFGGYSDMAIGLGRMFGFSFPENFRYPYGSQSVSEFWRRWHMTLGSWFRDYVYFPLGGSRTTRGRMIRNLFVVWLLTGLWHGANWTFVAWGLYYGVLIGMEKLTRWEKRRVPRVLRTALTVLLVMFGWVIFRSGSLAQAGQYLLRLFGFGAVGLTDSAALLLAHDGLPLLLIAAIGSTPLLKACAKRLLDCVPPRAGDVLRAVAVLALLAISTVYLVNATYTPFIYGKF